MSKNLPSWQALTVLAETAGELSITDLLAQPDRLDHYSASVDGLYVDYAKHLVTDEVMAGLIKLAEEADVAGRIAALFAGEIVNDSEQRAALHPALRDIPDLLGNSSAEFIRTEQTRVEQFSEQVRANDKITDVINVGIGGSDLGPKMVVAALREFGDGPNCHFISNVDGAEVLALLPTLNPESTLLIICSKTFTTIEALLNAKTIMTWLEDSLGPEKLGDHLAAVSSNEKAAVDLGVPPERVFGMLDSIGGRYSLWSSVGLAVSIHMGAHRFRELLDGGAAMDRHFRNTPLDQNLPVILALLGIWYSNFLGIQSYAVIPYCERLGLFVDHLQQLDMESNGKSVDRLGNPIETATGPVVWGRPGTNAQHAFFQLLHQGKRWLPVDFIGVVTDNLSDSEHHRVLLSNLIAQSEALMLGKPSDSGHDHYEGNRPSTTLLLDELTPYNLGLLISLYEHKVFAQAAVWNINPFDQWGVELGKQLSKVLADASADHDASTNELLRRTGLSN